MASQNSDKQYYLITGVRTSSNSSSSSSSKEEREVDLHAQSWKLPYSIDDKDLMFDGKPLNLLYEENRYAVEHRQGSREHVSLPLSILAESLRNE
jgi:hypothetical protein